MQKAIKLNSSQPILELLLGFILCIAVSASAQIQSGKTGIESLDTLPVYEWDIETERNSLPLTMLFSLFPGGGHFYSEHYVRGGFILAAELALTYEVFINKPLQQDRRFEQAKPYRDSVGKYTEAMLKTDSPEELSLLRTKRDRFANLVR